MTPRGLVAVALLCALAVLASHATLLNTPYFWDEAGCFIPAAWDIAREGRAVSVSATPNVHPPLVPAWVALVWRILGESIPATRLAMLTMGTLALGAAYLLAQKLAGKESGALGAVFLALSPLFYAQAMLAQLDMPAMLFTCLGLYLFLEERYGLACVACVALVLTKETGVLLPGLCCLTLLTRKRWRAAALFLIPGAALACWLWVVREATGQWLGHHDFAEYNLNYPLHPVRLSLALVRRAWFLLVDNGHWVGALALMGAWRAGRLAGPDWQFAAVFGLAHTLLVSVLGGAVLERYLLPVLPVLYAAFAAALLRLTLFWRTVSVTFLAGALLAGHLLNPLFYPFPYENNQAFLDFTALHQQATTWLERQAPGQRVLSAWPFVAELSHPGLGYVRRPFPVQEASRLDTAGLSAHQKGSFDVLVTFSKEWEPPWFLLRDAAWAQPLGAALKYTPPADAEWIATRFGLTRTMRFERRGQWVEIYFNKR
jgi:4-amino-4-deoxy-L-arabinose transferase-like glycosyltransferase